MKIICLFSFESAELTDYELDRVHLRRGGSYIKSPEWLASKRATINPKNENDYECLRCLTISAWNCNKITKKEFENIFDKDFSSHQRDCECLEQNNKSIALNVLFAPKIVKK